MTTRSMTIWTTLFIAAVLSAGLFVLKGCKKSEPTPPPETPAATTQGHEEHEHAATSAEQAKEAVAVAEQTTCPVMGGAIDKNLFTEYKGKKVYFCCPECKAKFEAEPEKYIAKLPQFKQ